MKNSKIHWFLVKNLKDSKDIILKDKELLHQFNRVLKFKPDEQIVLFDGKGTWIKCSIITLDKKECVLKKIESGVTHRNENELINLFFGIPKRNKFELILEKGTEVGVTSFNPIITDRTEKLSVKEERAQRILIEASEQSENPNLPLLKKTLSFSKVLLKLNTKNTFVFHTSGEPINIPDLKFFSEVNILIGPEGGWSPEELEAFKDKGFTIYKAGDSVLKTETACITIPFLFSVN